MCDGLAHFRSFAIPSRARSARALLTLPLVASSGSVDRSGVTFSNVGYLLDDICSYRRPLSLMSSTIHFGGVRPLTPYHKAIVHKCWCFTVSTHAHLHIFLIRSIVFRYHTNNTTSTVHRILPLFTHYRILSDLFALPNYSTASIYHSTLPPPSSLALLLALLNLGILQPFGHSLRYHSLRYPLPRSWGAAVATHCTTIRAVSRCPVSFISTTFFQYIKEQKTKAQKIKLFVCYIIDKQFDKILLKVHCTNFNKFLFFVTRFFFLFVTLCRTTHKGQK